MNTQKPDLRTAAQAVIDRWETPLWKDAPATAGYIAALRDALAAGCAIRAAQPAPQQEAQEAQEPCPSCRNLDIYACTCTFPTSRNTAPQPSPAAQGDALDAARWRALLACGRIRIIGTAGVTGTGGHDPKALDPNKQPYGNYVHFGAEFWSTFPDQDYYNTKENPAYARATLTEFADAARAAQEGK